MSRGHMQMALENISKILTIPELDRAGYMYIPVIQKGVKEMSIRGSKPRLRIEPMGIKMPRMDDFHFDYCLFYNEGEHEENRIGQIRLHTPGQAMITGRDLKEGVEIALLNYKLHWPVKEEENCVQIDSGAFSLRPGERAHEGVWTPTKYPHVFLGPVFPDNYKVWRMG